MRVVWSLSQGTEPTQTISTRGSHGTLAHLAAVPSLSPQGAGLQRGEGRTGEGRGEKPLRASHAPGDQDGHPQPFQVSTLETH